MAYLSCEYCGRRVESKPGRIQWVPAGGGWWGPERFERGPTGLMQLAEVACDRCVQRSLFLTLRTVPGALTLEPAPQGTIAAQACLRARQLTEYIGTPASERDALLAWFFQNGWTKVPAEQIGMRTDALVLSPHGILLPSGGWVPNPDEPPSDGIVNPMAVPKDRSTFTVYAHANYQTEDMIETWSIGRTVVMKAAAIELTEEDRASLREILRRQPSHDERGTDA